MCLYSIVLSSPSYVFEDKCSSFLCSILLKAKSIDVNFIKLFYLLTKKASAFIIDIFFTGNSNVSRTNALAFCSILLKAKNIKISTLGVNFYKTFLFVNKESWCVCPRLFLPVDLMFLRTNTQAFFRSIANINISTLGVKGI